MYFNFFLTLGFLRAFGNPEFGRKVSKIWTICYLVKFINHLSQIAWLCSSTFIPTSFLYMHNKQNNAIHFLLCMNISWIFLWPDVNSIVYVKNVYYTECQTINIGENQIPYVKNKNRSPTCTRDKIPKHL
jgi:hypothetical protein